MIEMGIEKIRILGNDYIGAWVTATDKFFLMSNGVDQHEEKIISEAIGVEGARISVGGSGLVGIYVSANSNGILVPYGMEDRELKELKEKMPNINIGMMKTEHNALKNNILANDKIAIINPHYGKEDERQIADVLHVEIIKMSIAGFGTVGANNILTNKGMVLNNRTTDTEGKKIAELTGMEVDQSTANLGAVSIGLCVVANSRGLVTGEATTGFELSRIANALGL